jgi:hypothetical protein
MLEINSYFTSPSSLFILLTEKQSHFAWCEKFDAKIAIKSEKIEANTSIEQAKCMQNGSLLLRSA